MVKIWPVGSAAKSGRSSHQVNPPRIPPSLRTISWSTFRTVEEIIPRPRPLQVAGLHSLRPRTKPANTAGPTSSIARRTLRPGAPIQVWTRVKTSMLPECSTPTEHRRAISTVRGITPVHFARQWPTRNHIQTSSPLVPSRPIRTVAAVPYLCLGRHLADAWWPLTAASCPRKSPALLPPRGEDCKR